MIIEMAKVRLMGPKSMLRPVTLTLQDLELVHLTAIEDIIGAHRHEVSLGEQHRRDRVERALVDIEMCLSQLEELDAPAEQPPPAEELSEGRIALLAHRLRKRLTGLAQQRRALTEEREALLLYQPLIAELGELLAGDRDRRRFSAYLLLLREGAAAATEALRSRLAKITGNDYQLSTRALASGETAILLLLPRDRAAAVDALLASARIEAAPVPAFLEGADLIDALPRMAPRLTEVDTELRAVRDRARELAHRHGPDLTAARRRLRDELVERAAEATAVETSHAFALEGWLPARRIEQLRKDVFAAHGALVAVEQIARDRWYGDEAPVVLSNPRVFEPFERILSLLPLPRYGTVDPTPFVAVFFPMFFGIIVGDVGYGLVMLLIALVLRYGAHAGGLRRDIARIATAVSLFTIIFGVLYGELFGDLGHRWFGMSAIWIAREEAVVPFLIVAVALGVAHLLIGLVLSIFIRRHEDPRAAIGRGITLLMLALIVVALLALFEQLPAALFTPAIIGLLVAFPILIALEGFTGLLELFTIFGHVLSYARVMALGTASVMLAVVANRMAGAFGSVAIGVAFALLFHLVNFAIALFSPTIHVLRLHYVEFFGTFYSPGGTRYKPLAHWKPASASRS